VCGFWGDHSRTGHTLTNVVDPYAGQICGEIEEELQLTPEAEVVDPPAGLIASSISEAGGGGTFARLKAAGLL